MFYSNAYLSSINKSPFNSQRPRGVPVVSRSSSSRCQNVKESIFEVLSYSTVRSATIKSYKVGIIYRLAQLLLLFYIVGWELILQKGYQATETVSSVVTTKVKGQGFVPVNKKRDKSLNRSDPFYYEKIYSLDPNVNYKILDTADYIIPPNEYNSIFLMTNYIETLQTRGKCDEEQDKFKAKCAEDSDCENLGTFMNAWNGIPTGKCILSSIDNKTKACEVRAWCPTEHDYDRKDDTLVRNVLNYTIFIKNDIEFKKFRKKERNIAQNITNKYISTCTYDPVRDPLCPVFKVGYILEEAEPDKDEKYIMLIKGGVVLIELIWNCNYDAIRDCLPIYSFRRFDTKQSNTASGFNFRFAHRFLDDGIEYRVLYKAYGLRFIINVSGQAGKFNIVPLMVSIGAGIGLMSLSVLVADCFLLHCTKNKDLYQRIKEFDLKEETGNNELEMLNEEKDEEEENAEATT